ncbi:hypothetical protein DF153_00065 [Burkholderia cenocepacia]|nr:hypothetical protein DF152_04595 [Burkholderia cenocepacia]RQU27578.1 hypothetical protein DF153_00065 [Burkholderia cenocepacia]
MPKPPRRSRRIFRRTWPTRSSTACVGTAASSRRPIRCDRSTGCDGAPVFAARVHWLPGQFLSTLYNRRRDAYGSDAARRTAFPVHVLHRMADAVGHDLAVVCKIGVAESVRGGVTAAGA